MRRLGTLAVVAGVAAAALSGCGGSHKQTGSRASPSASAHSASSAAAITATDFGMHILSPESHPWPKLRFGSLRIWDDGVTWRDLQPSGPGQWDSTALARLDAIVRLARDHHVKPMLVLGQTPAWESSRPHEPATYGPGAAAPPKRLADWSNYVSFLAKRYRGRIEAYEVWNEPCFTNQWSGTPRQLAKLTSAARLAIKRVDSRALVVSPSVPVENHLAPAFLRAYLPLVATQVDVVGVHLYPAPHQPPESVAPIVTETKTIMAVAGIRAPIWNTEENLGSHDWGDSYTGATAAALTGRAYLVELAGGVSRVYWYAADDRTWGAVAFEAPGFDILTPAGQAERTLYQWLVGTTPIGCRQEVSRRAWLCTFKRPGGATETAAWTTGGATTIPVPDGARFARRLDGTRTEVGRMVKLRASPLLLTR